MIHRAPFQRYYSISAVCTRFNHPISRLLDQVIAELAADKEFHVILDNYSTHKKTPNG